MGAWAQDIEGLRYSHTNLFLLPGRDLPAHATNELLDGYRTWIERYEIRADGEVTVKCISTMTPEQQAFYVDLFQKAGGSFVMLAKGNRSKAVTDACQNNGGFYLGSIGGPAARLAQDNIRKVEVLDFPELGMEAVWRIEVVNFPAFILVDDKGTDFFKKLGL
mgnify:CR=1 FL=1